MSVPSREHKVEGGPGPLCTGSGVYVGLVAGHRIECVDCGRRTKVKRGGYLGDHVPKRTGLSDSPAPGAKEASDG